MATLTAADAFGSLFGTVRGGADNPRWAAGCGLTPLTVCWNAGDSRKLLLRAVAAGELMGPKMISRAGLPVRVELYDATVLDISFGSETTSYEDGLATFLEAFDWHQLAGDPELTLGRYGVENRRRTLLLHWLKRWTPELTQQRWQQLSFKP